MPEVDQASAGEGEAEKKLVNEYRKRPWVAYLGLAGMVLFVAVIILNSVLQGRVTVTMQYGIVTSAHLVGAIAGAISLFSAPSSIREHQRTLRWVTILNAAFFLLFACKSWVLIQLHSP